MDERSAPCKALVLAGGGARGSYQVGVWRALMELDWHPQIITGTSVGSLNGAMFVLDQYETARDMWLAIRSKDEHSGSKVLSSADRAVMSFFGVRGIGTVYYLAYATGHADFPEGTLWSTAAFTIVLSVLVHGALAGPAMNWLDRRQGQAG